MSLLRQLNFAKSICYIQKNSPICAFLSYSRPNYSEKDPREWYSVNRALQENPKLNTSVYSQLIRNEGALIEDSKSKSVVATKLAVAKNTDELLSEIETINVNAVGEYEIIEICRYLFDHLKRERVANSAKHNILSSIGMQKLSKFLRHFGRNLMVGDLITALKLYIYLAAPESNITFQMILRLISKQANNLTLQQINYLSFLLEQLPKESQSSLSTALQMALPIIFESQINQLDPNDVYSCCDFLHMASKENMGEKVMDTIVEALSNNIKLITPKNAFSIIWSLSDSKIHSPNYEDLIQNVFKIIVKNFDSFSEKDLSMILTKISKKFCGRKIIAYYNEDFIEKLCQMYSSTNNSNAKNALFSLRRLSQFRHVNIEYLDKVSELVVKDPSLILNDDFIFLNILNGLASANYKPENWDILQSMLIEHPSLSRISDKMNLNVALILDFMTMGIFPEKIIRKIYSPEMEKEIENFSSQSVNSSQPLLLIDIAMKTLWPNYNGPMALPSRLQRWINSSKSIKKKYPLKGFLETGIGGENCVMTGIYHEGIHIDHGILYRKGGYPISIKLDSEDSEPILLNDIIKSPNSILLLIKVFPREAYATNTIRLRGTFSLESKIIKSLGHPVLEIDLISWRDLSDYEKIPYIMQKINEINKSFI